MIFPSINNLLIKVDVDPAFWVYDGIQSFPSIIHRVFVTIKNLLLKICRRFVRAFAEKIFISIIFLLVVAVLDVIIVIYIIDSYVWCLW